MLVKRAIISKRTKILLVALLIILLPGGYFVYDYFFGAKEAPEESLINTEAAIVPEPRVPTFDEKIFEDPQLFGLQRKKFAGFTEQHQGIVLSEDTPLPPKNISVNNSAVGQKLVISWQLPDDVNFNKVRLYRSTTPGNLGEVVATLDVQEAQKLMSYQDTEVVNNQTYYYLVRTVNVMNKESSNTFQPSGVPTDEFPPDPPSLAQVKALEDMAGEQMEISWVNPDDQDFVGVKIYRSSEKGLLGSLIYTGEGEPRAGQDQKRYFIDQTIEANITYYYTITSLDQSNNESTKNILATPYNYNPFIPIPF